MNTTSSSVERKGLGGGIYTSTYLYQRKRGKYMKIQGKGDSYHLYHLSELRCQGVDWEITVNTNNGKDRVKLLQFLWVLKSNNGEQR